MPQKLSKSDKELIKKIDESFKATNWAEKKSKKDILYSVASLQRRIKELENKFNETVKVMSHYIESNGGPYCIDMYNKVQDLNALYYALAEANNAMTFFKRGY